MGNDMDEAIDILKNEDYNVSQIDIKNLEEIRRCIKENVYKESKHAKEHLEFLEDMGDKLRKVAGREVKAGMGSWDVIKFIKEIKKVYDELYDVFLKLAKAEKEKKQKSVQPRKKQIGMRGMGGGSAMQSMSGGRF